MELALDTLMTQGGYDLTTGAVIPRNEGYIAYKALLPGAKTVDAEYLGALGINDIAVSLSPRFNNVDIDPSDIEKNMEKIADMQHISTLNGDEIIMGDGKLKVKAETIFANANGRVYNKVLGDVELNKRSLKDDRAHGMSPLKALTYCVIPDVIAGGEIIAYDHNWKNRGYRTYVIAAPIDVASGSLAGEYWAGVIVKSDANMQNLYTHDAVMIKKEEADTLKTGAAIEKIGVSGGNVSSLQSILQKLYKVNIGKTASQEFSDSDTKFSLREEDPPEKTGIAYKVFFEKDGKLYPPMVANPGGEDMPIGVWLNADVGAAAPSSKTGCAQVKAGGKGTQGGSGSLAFRPGWHLGDVPKATQFDRLNPETGVKELFPANFVWAECEYAMDEDYQDEAMSYGYTENGKFRHSYAGLPRVPENGYCHYRTNPNPDTVPWVITGAMKVKPGAYACRGGRDTYKPRPRAYQVAGRGRAVQRAGGYTGLKLWRRLQL